jgi:hypothetical protein
MYRIIKFPSTSHLELQTFEGTTLRYPVVFHPPRGRPKKELRLEKKEPSTQTCSRCHKSGHNMRRCRLPDETILEQPPVKKPSQKEKSSNKVPMCTMLSQMGEDFLGISQKKHSTIIS